MRTSLPNKPWNHECGVVNMDDESGPGTHWVAYKKVGKIVIYFDSFGNLSPPKELVNYFRGCQLYFNHNRLQSYNTSNCGQLCVKFLYENHPEWLYKKL